MSKKRTITITTYATLAALAGLTFTLPGHLSPSEVAADPPMGIDEVVLYAIDADLNQLLRYSFDSTEYNVVGTVRDQNGAVVEDMESLAYIPAGPHKGLYTSPQDGPFANHLVRVSMLDATGEGYAAAIGSDDVVGMISHYDSGTDTWSIRATTTGRDLITIDLATGVGTTLSSVDET